MLESYFSYRGVLKRLRSGALGDEMDRIAEHFLSLGYKRASATQIFYGFSAHCGGIGARTRSAIGPRTIHCFSTKYSR